MIQNASPVIGEKEMELIRQVVDSGMLAQGSRVAEFEKRFAELAGVKHAIAVNSGTAALHCCTNAIGLKKDDEVITVPFTFVATANSIIMQGAKPVFVDIDETTFNIDANKIEAAITPQTKAIMAVNLYGYPAEFDEIDRIAAKHNLFVIEDAAQSVLANYKGRVSGSLGHLAAFSFYATKNLITGEGGMITTNNPEFAELCRRFRHHGQSEQTRYEYHALGYNYRMTDIMAAIGLAQLDRVKELTKKRQKNAKLLTEGLNGVPGIILPNVPEGLDHVFHQYTIRITDQFPMNRDKLKEHLKANGFNCGVFYPKPLHMHPHFMGLGYKEGDFPVSEKISKQVLSLPVHPKVTEEQLKKMVEIIRGAK